MALFDSFLRQLVVVDMKLLDELAIAWCKRRGIGHHAQGGHMHYEVVNSTADQPFSVVRPVIVDVEGEGVDPQPPIRVSSVTSTDEEVVSIASLIEAGDAGVLHFGRSGACVVRAAIENAETGESYGTVESGFVVTVGPAAGVKGGGIRLDNPEIPPIDG